jgi:hypothetical protein
MYIILYKTNKIMKQETLEEASLLSRPIHLIWDEDERYDCNEEFREEFKKGAKWQQEEIGKSEFLQRLRGTLSDAEARRLIFEKFKNK